MTGIGNPNIEGNPYKGIKIAPKPTSSKESKDTRGVGKNLNDLAGVKQESFFKDAKEHNKLGKDAFLKLLTHQLKNQDPYKPMDQKEFSSDLAQFSQLEQLSSMNKKLDGMNKNAPKENKFYGASFLGKKVETLSSSIEFSGSGNVNLPFSLEKPARKMIVRVFDSTNQMIKQMDFESRGAGSNSIIWDGKQSDGYLAKKGAYRFEVRAWDKDLNEFKGSTHAEGVVTGVHFDEGGSTVLVVDGSKKVFLRDVKSFKLPDPAKAPHKLPGLQKTAQGAYNNMRETIQ